MTCPEQNGVFHHGSMTEYRYERPMIDYACSEGYTLVGIAKQICEDDGKWHPPEKPKCVLKGVYYDCVCLLQSHGSDIFHGCKCTL